MKKKFLLIALMVVMVVCALAISASAIEHGGIYYSLDDSKMTAALTNENVNCKLEIVNIPETITIGEGENAKTYTVTSLWSDAFAGSGWPGNKTVKKITVPKTVSSIGTHCFRNCTALEEAYINGTTKSFSNAEFYGCTSLWKLDMSGMTEEVTIGQYFAFNTAISDLKLPPRLTKISGTTPFKTSALTTLVLPDTVEHLGDCAFQNCSSLTSVKLSSSLEYLGCNNFQSSKIKEIIIPASVTTVKKDTFHGSTLQKVVFASTSVTSFTSSMFSSTGSLNLFFYAGETEAEAREFTANFGSRFDGWTYIPYDEYDDTKTYKTTIVYGTTNCGECSDILGDAALYDTGVVTKLQEKVVCSCGAETVVKEYDVPVKFLGVSINELGTSICIGYQIDYKALENYETLTNKEISFGVVAYAPKEGDDVSTLKPVNDDLTLKDADTTIFASLSGTFASFEFKLTGFDETTKNTELVMCAFVNDGSAVSYLNVGSNGVAEQSAYASTLTFSQYE
jgi:hypothetical protein